MNCPEVRNVKDVILTLYKCLHNEKDVIYLLRQFLRCSRETVFYRKDPDRSVYLPA